jgi:hypothetical protein
LQRSKFVQGTFVLNKILSRNNLIGNHVNSVTHLAAPIAQLPFFLFYIEVTMFRPLRQEFAALIPRLACLQACRCLFKFDAKYTATTQLVKFEFCLIFVFQQSTLVDSCYGDFELLSKCDHAPSNVL